MTSLRNGDEVMVLNQDGQPVRCIANSWGGSPFQAFEDADSTPCGTGTWGVLREESEGVWWARGWDDATADALRAASLLARSA